MDKGGYGGGLSLDTANSESFAFFANKQQPLFHKRKSMDYNLGFSMRIEDNRGDFSPKKRVDEVDFFSDEKKKMKMDCSDTDLDLKVAIKKEDLSINTNLHLLTANMSSNQSTVHDGVSQNEENKDGKSELAVMQAELARMNEENQRLRGVLSQVTNNYNALQVHLLALMQQRAQRNSNDQDNNGNEKVDVKKYERQFMDLGPASNSMAVDGDETSLSSTEGGGSLNRSSSPAAANNGVTNKDMSTPFDHERSNLREGSPDRGSQDWAPNKQVAKLVSSSSKGPEQAQEATMRKARVSVRARSEAPMISDGCQWRKYGQKMAKGNPCPRAYYRCTMATGCPVRKQVQRCADDRTILITTYEGNHNHPLPPAAMAMASTTSAAASMLLSGSMSSSDGLMNPTNFLSRTILPCSSSVATISASAPFPTVTLDLTQTNPQNPPQFPIPPRPPAQLQLNSLPQVFGQVPYSNQSKFSGLQMSPEVVESGQFGQPKSLPGQATASLADTVSAATAAITADPNFTVALAAAIKSIIGGGSSANGNSSSTTSGNGKESNKTAGSSCFPS